MANDDVRWIQRLQNFEKALAQLGRGCYGRKTLISNPSMCL